MFEYCKSLTSIVIPESVSSIGDKAFYCCFNLASIQFPSNLEHVGAQAFIETAWIFSQKEDAIYIGNVLLEYHGWGNEHPIIREGTTVIADEAFKDRPIVGVSLPAQLKSIGNHAFENCTKLEEIVIPDAVSYIGLEAFANCTNLRTAIFPANLVSVQFGLFANCTSLRDVVLPQSLSSVAPSLFYGCTALENITIPDSVISIGYNAFAECSSLKNVILNKQVQTIESGVFSGCQSMEHIVAYSQVPPYAPSSFAMNEDCKLFVPESAFDEYSSSEPWKSFKTICKFEDKPIVLNETKREVSSTSASIYFAKCPLDSAFNYGLNAIDSFAVQRFGLTPNFTYNIPFEWDSINGSSNAQLIEFQTGELELTVQPAQAVSNTKAIISATTNGKDDGLRFGFEWRRYDAPELVPSNVVRCPVYNGILAGTLSNLSANTYYKYRPFYTSDAGNTYYGEWIAFGTADAYVYFEPVVHTLAASHVTESTATLSGSVVAGSDEVTEQGFEYWEEASNDAGQQHFLAHASDGYQTVTASGTLMSATLSGLSPMTRYHFRAYVKTEKEVTYGEENIFVTAEETTGVICPSVEDVNEVTIVARYDMQGRKLDRLQPGVNIIRFSDGRTKKVFVR